MVDAEVLGSIYGFLQGAWPFGVVEAVWAVLRSDASGCRDARGRHKGLLAGDGPDRDAFRLLTSLPITCDEVVADLPQRFDAHPLPGKRLPVGNNLTILAQEDWAWREK
jgi:hypothetical protein